MSTFSNLWKKNNYLQICRYVKKGSGSLRCDIIPLKRRACGGNERKVFIVTGKKREK